MTRASGRASALAALAFALAGLASADEPPKMDQARFDARWKELSHSIATAEDDLAKRLEKGGFAREAYLESVLALEADPEDKVARERLGYKKIGNDWRGFPALPGKSAKALDDIVDAACTRTHTDSARRIGTLAKQAKAGGLDAAARKILGIALDFDPDDSGARAFFDHRDVGSGMWVSARESALRDAFGKALRHEDESEPGKDEAALDQELEDHLKLGPLTRQESAHAVYLSTRRASVGLAQFGPIVEAPWAAWRYFLAGDDKTFSLRGDPRVEGLPVPKEPESKPRFLFVADDEHPRWVEKAFPEKEKHDYYKSLDGTRGSVALASGKKVFVFETRIEPSYRTEWASAQMTYWLIHSPLPEKARCSDFLVEGFRRFLSGHASGRAAIKYVGEGTTGIEQQFKQGTFEELRSRVRGVLKLSFEDDLRALLSKSASELETADGVRACAFVDFLFAKKRPELARFLAALKPDELPPNTFEASFKVPFEALEREFRAWARGEY